MSEKNELGADAFTGNAGEGGLEYGKAPSIPEFPYESKYCPKGCSFTYTINDLFKHNYQVCEHSNAAEYSERATRFISDLQKMKECTALELFPRSEISADNQQIFAEFLNVSDKILGTSREKIYDSCNRRYSSHHPQRERDQGKNTKVLSTLVCPTCMGDVHSKLQSKRLYSQALKSNFDVEDRSSDIPNENDAFYQNPISGFNTSKPLITENLHITDDDCIRQDLVPDTFWSRDLDSNAQKLPMDDIFQQNSALSTLPISRPVTIQQHPTLTDNAWLNDPDVTYPNLHLLQDSSCWSSSVTSSVWNRNQSFNSADVLKINRMYVVESPVEGISKQYCSFCKNSGKPELIYTSHSMKDRNGFNFCPYLRCVICPLCRCIDPNISHTMRYCPKYRESMLDEASRNMKTNALPI